MQRFLAESCSSRATENFGRCRQRSYHYWAAGKLKVTASRTLIMPLFFCHDAQLWPTITHFSALVDKRSSWVGHLSSSYYCLSDPPYPHPFKNNDTGGKYKLSQQRNAKYDRLLIQTESVQNCTYVSHLRYLCCAQGKIQSTLVLITTFICKVMR